MGMAAQRRLRGGGRSSSRGDRGISPPEAAQALHALFPPEAASRFHDLFRIGHADVRADAQRYLSERGAIGQVLFAANAGAVAAGLADVEGRLRSVAGVRHEVERVAEFLDAFDGLWDALVPAERRELLHVLVHRVAVDTAMGQLRIKLHDLKERSPTSADIVAEATP